MHVGFHIGLEYLLCYLWMDASNYSISFDSTMEEVQIIDIEEVDNKLCNDKKKSEIEEKLLSSLVISIKALAEYKTNPLSFKDKPNDEICIIDEAHKLEQMEDIVKLITNELEEEILIIDEIKQLPRSNVCCESDNIKIEPKYKNKDGEYCNKQPKEPSTVLEIDLDDDKVITNDERTEPVLEVVTARE